MPSRPMTFSDIEGLSEDEIRELADLIRKEKGSPATDAKPSLLEKIQRIKIDAPADFSERVLNARHGEVNSNEF